MKRESIRTKTLKNLIMFSLIPVILFCSAILGYFLLNVNKNGENELKRSLQSQTEQLDKLLAQAYQIGCTVRDDEMVHLELNKSFSSEKELYRSEILLNSTLINISKFCDENLRIYVVGENGGQYKSCAFSLMNVDHRESAWYQDIVDSGNIKWYDMQEQSFLANTIEMGFVSLGIPIYNKQSGSFLGMVLVEVYVHQILQEEGCFYLFYPDTDFRIVDDKVELYDEDRMTFLSDGEIAGLEDIEEEYPRVSETTEILTYWKEDFEISGLKNFDRYIVVYNQLNANDWIWVHCVERAEFYYVFKNILRISLIVIVALLAIVIYISYKMTESITRPIMDLKSSVEKLGDGDFDISVEPIANDEIGDLEIQFNKMVLEIRNLMDRIQLEHERQREYELMLLQVQINPHFLYNTLDSLMWLIRMKRQDDAQKMLEALTKFLKTGLNKGKDLITVSKELENVESYLTIQKLRYKKKLSYIIESDEKIENYIIPKLILQPLVENAIYHGIKEKEHGGIIHVRAWLENKEVILAVEDTGNGMNRERLNDMRRILSKQEVILTDHYGITNVNERLHLYFKKGCYIEMQSIAGVGTSVMLHIKEDNFIV